MKRPALLASAAAVAAAAVAASWLLRPEPRRPHIVVLLWDTTRADRLGAYGYGRRTTPWLESVAARGVLFEQCRAPSPWTLPSHASLFTGLLPRHHGAVTKESPLAPAHETLAERLKAAGYGTMLLSNNEFVGPEAGLAQGFDVFRSVVREAGRPSADATVGILERELAARRADAGRAGKPLFLFVNLMEPHLPYEPPSEFERPWRPEGATEGEVRRARRLQFPEDMAHNLGIRPWDGKTLSILSSLYDAEIREMDGQCARMEKVLADAGILGDGANGILVVTADHGENLGEHGLVDHKLSVAETLLRVPLVVRWPGRYEGGRRVREPVRLQDLFPTLLEAAGVPAPPSAAPHAASIPVGPVEGRVQVSEFVPPVSFLDGMRRFFPDRPAEVFAPFRIGLLAAVEPAGGGRRLKWLRTWRLEEGGKAAVIRECLFDLEADPREDRDLLAGPSPAPADADAAKRLGALADSWVAPLPR